MAGSIGSGLIGTTLSHYKITAKLGEGGMGAVYRARDTKLGREVAIKVLPEPLTEEPERLARFEREARALASLDHPNIAAIHHLEEQAGRHFLVMELVEGEDLAARLARGPLPVDEALSVARQIAEGLQAAHRRGVVHRDLKPANVMIASEDRVKILDFGLAKIVSEKHEAESGPTAVPQSPEAMTRLGAILGTAAYMSPEQARGQTVGVRTDIWAWGAIFYELLTGRRTFEGDTVSDILVSVLTREPDWDALPDGTPPRARDVLRRSLRKERERRLPEIGDALIALETTATTSPGETSHRPTAPRIDRSPLSRPVRMIGASLVILAVLAVALWQWSASDGRARDEQTVATGASLGNSLAILPIENLTGDPGNEHLADGMTEELISAVGQIRAFGTVISRTSVMRYKDARPSLPRIGEALGVEWLVEASLLEFGENVRFSLRLYTAANEEQIWSSTYESDVEEVQLTYGEVALAIAERVGALPTPDEQERLGIEKDLEKTAYEQYMLGRFYWHERTAAGHRRAIGLFERALELDPDYADAYVGLADCYVLLPTHGDMSPREASLLARDAAERALELDPSSGPAHAALAYTALLFDWEWDRAGAEFQTALSLNPSDATTHFHYAAYLAAMGRMEAAIAEARRAAELAPVTPIINAGVAWMYHYERQHDRAAAWARRTLDLDPQFAVGHMRLGVAYQLSGRHAEAIESLERAVATSDHNPEWMALLGHALGVAGRERHAREILAELLALSERRHVSAYATALVHLGLGEHETTLDLLEEAYDERSFYMPFIRYEPYLDPLRSEERFREIGRRMGFPDG